jgi:Na+-transporting methylmalonyl-CoA/oxaloacetate decarboxylase beta subunit
MNKRAVNFWLIFVVALIAFTWMSVELFRVFFEVKSQSGLSAVLFDGVMQHKIGELMVGIPFVAVLALSNLWAREKVLSLIRQTQFVMIMGGLLNALAWYSLREKVEADSFLRIWCLVIFVFGLIGSWLLSWMISRTKNKVEKSI